MAYETIKVEPLSPIIGTEIEGVDISKPLSNQMFQDINDALMEHQVVFFRDQEMTLDEHKAFGRLFGELHIHPAARHTEGHPKILTTHADKKSKVVAGMKWHSDVSCDAEPPMGSILHLHEIPRVGGDTMFASMYATYDALSEPVKEFIIDLQAWHESAPVHRDRLGHKGALRDGENAFPEAQHPVTGRKYLFVNENFTTRIEGLKTHESDAVLKILCDHIACLSTSH